MHLTDADFTLLRDVQRIQARQRLNVEELSAALQMSPSLLVRRLKAMQDAGWIERKQEASPRGRAVYYLPKARVSVQWSSPRHGLAIAWSAEGEVDWDFPLVSQVPDAPTRASIRRFLWAMRQAGLLDNEIHWHGETPVVSSSPGLTLVAFGSSARGSAHATSDVDLLVLLEGRETSTKAALRANERAVLDAAADASMESPRPLQVKVIHARDFATLPKEILGALSQDGLIVHDSAAHSPLWQIVYGGERA